MNMRITSESMFNVVVFCPIMTDLQLESIIRSFNRFFHSLTPKHFRKVKFIAIDPTVSQTSIVEHYSSQKNDPFETIILIRSLQTQLMETLKVQNSILVYPSISMDENARISLLSLCLPIMTYDNCEKIRGFEDASCVFIPNWQEERVGTDISNMLRVLYFDQGALKMLREKALLHRRSTFTQAV